MSETAQQWLIDRASPPGTLACGLRRPDGNFASRSIEESCPVETIENILGHFEILTAAVFAEPPAPRWSTWSFEKGQLRFIERADGWRLALIVRTDSDAAQSLDALSTEFLSAPLDN